MSLKKYFIIFFIIFLTACGTTGKDFGSGFAKWIKNDVTTRQDIAQELGEPNRKGMTDGDEWWIYEYNTYKLLWKSYSKDLTITFDNRGVVKAYNYSSNFPEETAR